MFPHHGAVLFSGPTPFDQSHHRLRLDWGPMGAAAVAAGAEYAVVVDVLSFTTTLSVALDAGMEVLPYPWKDASAEQYARDHGATLAVGRSEGRPGRPSLSPASVRASTGVSRLVLPSPNGSSISFLLRDRGATVVGASLRNAAAVGAWLADRLTGSSSVAVVAAGERWPDGSLRPALEDLLGAGAVVAALQAAGVHDVSPDAAAAAAAYRDAAPRLSDTLRRCSSGRELVERGYAQDVEIALEQDSAAVPVLRAATFVQEGGSTGESGG